MALDILKGRKCMVWTFMGNTRMYTALKNYGDRLSQVGLFSFKVDATGTITESGVAISDMLTHINMWPHITWLLTVRNDGTSSVFTVLRENTDGAQKHFTESRLWWPYWRSTFWASLADGISLSAGTHTITVSVDVKGVQFYGFRVCSNFSEEPSAGSASFTLSPRHFIDVDGNKCQPDKGFKLTCEMLLRKPDSALIWYEDFRTRTFWRRTTGRRCQAHGRSGGRMNTLIPAFIRSLKAADSSRGTMTDSVTSTFGCGLRFRQEALQDWRFLRRPVLLPELRFSSTGAVERQHKTWKLQSEHFADADR